MSLRKHTSEIKRLIQAFQNEADKFHDITFRKFYVSSDYPTEDRKFRSPNHTIMLWQFYGELTKDGDSQRLADDLFSSDLQWGVKGAEFSSFGIIEGEACDLFVRMAKRAASLFNKKEVDRIKSGISEDIFNSRNDRFEKPAVILNDNTLAIWLNYLLYYISEVNPGRQNSSIIEPDPFSLSLLALEDLLLEPKIYKVDKSVSDIEELNFKVALSFPGEKRAYVSAVADFLRQELGEDQIFYDFDYQAQLARPSVDTVLQNIYRNQSDLIVVFLCEDYSEKQWCHLEWRAIRDIIKSKEEKRVMFIRFDDANIEGVFSIDGFIDANKFSAAETAKLITKRIMLN